MRIISQSSAQLNLSVSNNLNFLSLIYEALLNTYIRSNDENNFSPAVSAKVPIFGTNTKLKSNI